MYTRRLRSSPLWVFGLAFAGVVAGHGLSFFLEAPDHHHREELLESTGHGSWWIAVGLALAFFLASTAAFVVRRIDASERGPERLVRRTAYRLAPLQVIAFVALEAFERWTEGELSGVLTERVVLVGIVVQVAIALLAALVVAVVSRVVAAVIDMIKRRALREVRPGFPTSQLDTPPLWLLFRAREVRGPPLRSS